MRMKAFCEATGLSRDTVNFYIRCGLLEPGEPVSSSNPYRYFGADQVDTVRMIVSAKRLGFTLGEIKTLATRYRITGTNPDQRRAVLHEQLEQLAERRKALDLMESALLAKLSSLEDQEQLAA